uniref:Uncharacterized protein n=1 Tax=viral metagenome TaxID=1070528 RepID=A0A6M3JNR9_9ZZZZ
MRNTNSDCYIPTNKCTHQYWECLICKHIFCTYHTHVTAKGVNVECWHCEALRVTELRRIDK